jgi:catechol 2,3-dioxygenase-like lactoylglutathione lyase family enzyme
MLKIGSIVMNVSDVPSAARFWADALGYEPRDGEIGEDWAIIKPTDGTGPNLSFDLRDRTHLDLYTRDADDQQAEIERLIGLGAKRVEDWPCPPDADFVVLQDPTGTLFCVIDGGA